MQNDHRTLFHRNGAYSFSCEAQSPFAVLRDSIESLERKGKGRLVAELSKSLVRHCKNIKTFRGR
ncbi:hypothetical protein D3C80_2141620 [compost metagenome]